MKPINQKYMNAHRDLHRKVNPWHLYEMQKNLWDSEHPDATYQERDRAMRQIANRLGV